MTSSTKSTQRLRVMVADDHTLFIEGIVRMLSEVDWIEVVTTATTGEEVIRKLHSYYVDLILLDIHMPKVDGIQTAELLKVNHPGVQVVILSMYSERMFVERCYRAGVAGYLLKNSTSAEVLRALDTVWNGGRYFSPEVTASILGESLSLQPLGKQTLTARESEVLVLLVKGLSTADVAKALNLSPQTVSTHRKNIMHKLNVKNAAALVRHAITEGLVR